MCFFWASMCREKCSTSLSYLAEEMSAPGPSVWNIPFSSLSCLSGLAPFSTDLISAVMSSQSKRQFCFLVCFFYPVALIPWKPQWPKEVWGNNSARSPSPKMQFNSAEWTPGIGNCKCSPGDSEMEWSLGSLRSGITSGVRNPRCWSSLLTWHIADTTLSAIKNGFL